MFSQVHNLENTKVRGWLRAYGRLTYRFYVMDYCNNSAKDGTVTEQKQKTELDLNIPPKSE